LERRKRMHKKILSGLDGSEGSFKALQEAMLLARLFGAELHTITVEAVPRYAGTIGEVIEEKSFADGKYGEMIATAGEMGQKEGVTIHSHVFVGHEVKTIMEFVRRKTFDLLVIGFMGRSALYDRMMGSTCSSLVRLAPCTVVVVK
jgi:nucleotide-binding universal stress UspA family protein